MFQDMAVWLRVVLSFAVALIVSYFMTPPVKGFAERVGAIDVPRDGRRVHDHPIPRMGGLAIFIGFVVAMILFVSFTTQVLGLMLGALIIAAMGAVDDIVNLRPWIKLSIQIIAALVAIRCGIMFTAVSNPNFMSDIGTISVGSLAIPLTVLWIVGCTNAVNLIDGLDGLAVGVSAISSLTMMVVSSPPCAARAWASCRTTSTQRRYSWATSGRSFWASCWPVCPSWAFSSCTP